MLAVVPPKRELLSLYRALLRACESYPSKNRLRIYESIRQDFRENVALDPASVKAQQQIQVAFKGLEQLRQFDGRSSASFQVTLEQNPFPKPNDYVDRRTRRAEEIIDQDMKKDPKP